ncbi:Alpha/Beta hydrolase protein [Dimargaris cristalligena]|uniref:Alpha/Beta hydrolase protein n=1 Tax=Dimargaris cristalligena TaxID=215637 RepID=A0A4Q0A2H7_9FUNG|nr:Alpha/Beta hydrolase protein [Dimargaris cristalligena]|eukprot:RKP40336.1 Alpha/Beta hydrolase protein [Dimargaris cristalligena]
MDYADDQERVSSLSSTLWGTNLNNPIPEARCLIATLWSTAKTAIRWSCYLFFGVLLLPFSFPILGLLTSSKGFQPLALPWNPIRVLKMSYAALENLSDLFSGPFPIVLRWIIEKVFARRTPPEVVIRNVRYGQAHPQQILDVYMPELAGPETPLRGTHAVPSTSTAASPSESTTTNIHLVPDDMHVLHRSASGQSISSDRSAGPGLGHAPVICFIYGKTWCSTQRKVYVPMAHTLRKQGYLVILPELRRPPSATIADAIDDTLQCLTWLVRHAPRYGGDPSNIFLMGHGAGAHICTMAATIWTLATCKTPQPLGIMALNPSEPGSPGECTPPASSSNGHGGGGIDILAHIPDSLRTRIPWSTTGGSGGTASSPFSTDPTSPSSTSSGAGGSSALLSNARVRQQFAQLVQKYTSLARENSPLIHAPQSDQPFEIAGLILMAGVYDIDDQHRYEKQRGIDEISATTRLVGSCSSDLFSPSVLLANMCHQANTALSQSTFPKRILLIHGEKDTVIPLKSSELFFDLLCQLDVEDVNLKVYSRTKSMNPAITLLTESASLCQSILEDIRSTVCDNGGI